MSHCYFIDQKLKMGAFNGTFRYFQLKIGRDYNGTNNKCEFCYWRNGCFAIEMKRSDVRCLCDISPHHLHRWWSLFFYFSLPLFSCSLFRESGHLPYHSSRCWCFFHPNTQWTILPFFIKQIRSLSTSLTTHHRNSNKMRDQRAKSLLLLLIRFLRFFSSFHSIYLMNSNYHFITLSLFNKQ